MRQDTDHEKTGVETTAASGGAREQDATPPRLQGEPPAPRPKPLSGGFPA